MNIVAQGLLRALQSQVGQRVMGVAGPPPPPGPIIVAANHTSYFDHFVLGWWLVSNGRPLPRFLSKSELFDTPISARFNRLGGGIPISRGGVDPEGFVEAQRVLESGGTIVLYPEGTRSRDGWMRAPRRGAAALAARTGAPIVPVGLLGTARVLPVGARVPRPVRRVVVHSGEPVHVSAPGREEERAITREVMQRIAALSGQWPHFLDAPAVTTSPVAPALLRSRARALHTLVERGFAVEGDASLQSFTAAERLSRRQRGSAERLERGRALGQLARRASSPITAVRHALAARRSIVGALRARPTDPLAWHVWAVLLESLPPALGGDEAAASSGHRMAAALAPSSPRYVYHLAESLTASGRTDEAIRFVDRTLEQPGLVVDDPHVARLFRHRRALATAIVPE